jgi:hypothetical protein
MRATLMRTCSVGLHAGIELIHVVVRKEELRRRHFEIGEHLYVDMRRPPHYTPRRPRFDELPAGHDRVEFDVATVVGHSVSAAKTSTTAAGSGVQVSPSTTALAIVIPSLRRTPLRPSANADNSSCAISLPDAAATVVLVQAPRSNEAGVRACRQS